MKMTPRERVMASVNHQNPDSLPMDLGSNVSAGISGMAYGKLKEYLGITTGHNRIYDVVQQVAQPEIQVLDIIGADVLDVGRVFNTEDSNWYDVTLSNGVAAQRGMANSGPMVKYSAQVKNTLYAPPTLPESSISPSLRLMPMATTPKSGRLTAVINKPMVAGKMFFPAYCPTVGGNIRLPAPKNKPNSMTAMEASSRLLSFSFKVRYISCTNYTIIFNSIIHCIGKMQ